MNSEPRTIDVDGEPYDIDKFDDNQKYLLTQIEDLTKKVSSIKFQLDQVQVARDVFTQNLIEALKAQRNEENA
tara:strand:- start:803 stop:1021 length:219 start_codon:yes stop_codon:yes gene_type:complete